MPLANFISFIISLIDGVLVPLIFAIAFIVFIWGVYTYFILGAGNDEKRKEGRSFIIYGLIGFFVMISVWGLVNILVNTFGFNRASRPNLPSFGPSTGIRNNPFQPAGSGGINQPGGGNAPSPRPTGPPPGVQSHGSCLNLLIVGFCSAGTCYNGQCYRDGT